MQKSDYPRAHHLGSSHCTQHESIQVPFFFSFKTLGFFSSSIPLPSSPFNLSNSCSNTRIEDCYIVSDDDCIAIKSGWDQYGIKFGMLTEDLVILQLSYISPDSAGIALGSEMSGGICNVKIENVIAINKQSAVRIKTARGRGGFVKDIFVRRMFLSTMKYVFWITRDYKLHADDKFDPSTLTLIKNINYRDMVAENVNMSTIFAGFQEIHSRIFVLRM